MAIERIDIVISETGGKVTTKAITDVGTAAEETGEKVRHTNSILEQFKGIIAALGVGVTLKGLQTMADTYRDITNALQLVTKDTAELKSVEQELFDISQKTTTSFKGNVEIYSQLRQGAAQYGFETKDVIELTNTLAQAIDASGKSSESAKGAIQQLAKSVAQGEVGGRALVAVFQQVPLVARAIAADLNVPISKLNNMAAAGELTGKELLKALKGSELIAAASAQKIDTIGDAWGNVTNALIRYVGQLDQGRGISQIVISLLITFAENISRIANTLLIAAGAWAGYRIALIAAAVTQPIFTAVLAASSAGLGIFTIALRLAQIAVGTFVGLLEAAFLILRAHPFIFLATAIGAAVVAIIQFGDSIKINGISVIAALKAAVDLLNQGLAFLGAFLEPVIDAFFNGWRIISQFAVALSQDVELIRVLQPLLIGLGAAIALTLLPGLTAALLAFVGVGEAVTVLTGGALGDFTTKVIEAAVALKDNFVAAATDAQKSMDAAATSNKKFTGSLDDIKTSVDGATKAMKEGAKGVSQEFGSAAELHKRWADAVNKSFEDAMADLQRLREEQEKTANQTQNAFGQMIEITDEWARRSGAAFNKVSESSRSMRDDVKTATESAVPGGSSTSGGSTGTTKTGTASIAFQTAEAVFQSAADLREALDAFNTAKTPTESARAKANLAKMINSAIFNTGNQFGNPRVSRAQQDSGLLGLVAAARGILGFARGGAFDVGGYGGTDSRLVQFMATPGERVTVETPAQVRAGQGGGRPIVINMSIATPDANSFRRSETQISQALIGKLSRAAEMY